MPDEETGGRTAATEPERRENHPGGPGAIRRAGISHGAVGVDSAESGIATGTSRTGAEGHGMTNENYKLECQQCQRTVTLPARDGQHACPSCGATLCIQWSAARIGANEPQEALKGPGR